MFSNFKVGNRLFFLTAFASIITAIVVLFGVYGMGKITDNVDSMYNERALALTQLGRVVSGIGVVGLDIFRALQHDPSSELSKLHADHTMTGHLDQAERLLKEIDEAWGIYASTPLAEEEKVLLSQFNET
ncbi:MAG: MCP four helix bundle domain-containing protein [Azoarcus sp.]|jgi:methyl-accepting chemotaxis protein-1 (serine sensor receptor)|nr:MCP four helix bundle domain-containing protein [Azoarcus sp.]